MNGSLSPWIDRLVDGELDGSERRKLLSQLECEPDGWRSCALAFLEARELRAALGTTIPTASPRPEVKPAKTRHRLVERFAALAAALAIAFGAGWAARTPSEPAIPIAEIQHHDPASNNANDPQTVEPEPAPPVYSVDPVVQHWEHKGYLADRQQRLVAIQLSDGRRVQVPVQEVRLRDVRGRSF